MPSPAIHLVLDLGRALSRYGAPAHRLEDAMAAAARRVGLKGEFFSTPTSIMATFDIDGQDHTSVCRLTGSEVDLTKLIELDHLSSTLGSETDPAEGRARIQAIIDAPVPYRRTLTVLSYGLVSGAAARFFGGGAAEIGVGAVIGVVIGVMSIVLGRTATGGRALELLSAFVASMIASFFLHHVTPVATSLATLAGMIVLIPGLTLTTAMTEIATRNLVSGSARLTATAIVFLQLIFGIALGARVEQLVWGASAPVVVTPLPLWTFGVALLAACVGLVVLFRAPPDTGPPILVAATLALLGARFGGQALGAEIGMFVGAYLVCLAGNLYARIRKRPAVVLIVPGLLLLVPGSIGFRSLSELLARDPLAGVTSAFQTGLAAMSIVAGFLIANITLPPRRIL